ncbi:hypothetical protein Tco_1083041 [Tanacetum coccineum]|uniref:Uncharacterized protein n=1 Tax=Tanacetum coccineum TaxID=301880 RepID=A0ABQ5I3B2_9ASTR
MRGVAGALESNTPGASYSAVAYFRGVTDWYLEPRFAMSSDNASSAIDQYEEVAQQGQAHPLSHAYAPDPMELDEHVPVYVPEPEHPEYHAPSDDDIQVEDQPYTDDASPTAESSGYIADSDLMEEDSDTDSIDYPDEPEDGEEDDDEDPEEDPSEENEPEDDDDDDDTGDEDEEPTEDEEEEEHLAKSAEIISHHQTVLLLINTFY